MARETRLDRERRLIRTPLGEKGSGMARYAAAMYLNRKGLVGDDLLEIYRTCCRQDSADPRAVARAHGIEFPRDLFRPD